LSPTEKEGEVPYLALEQGHTLRIPPNVWFIVRPIAMNTTFVISDKVYTGLDHELHEAAAKVRNYSDPIPQQFYDYETINRLLSEAKKNGNSMPKTMN
jgi:hypothetical protein